MPKSFLVAIILSPLPIITYFWWQGSGSTLTLPILSPTNFIIIGRLAGLLAVYSVLLQVTLIGRFRWLESSFGLDKLAKIHKKNGRLALIFLLIHFGLILLGYSEIQNRDPITELLALFQTYPDVLKAFLGLNLFLLAIFSAIVLAKRVSYEVWYFVHLVVYAAILLAFSHQFTVGSDLLSQPLFRYFWYGLYLFVFGNLLVYRLIRPLYLFQKHQFKVEKVIPETKEASSVYITGRYLDSFQRAAGQFFFFYFLAPGFWWQKHPFSLSCSPSENFLRITPKAVGDYTSKIPLLSPGTKVIIDGPYGTFTKAFATKDKFLFLAGGIGITPIRSLIGDLAPTGQDLLLLYSNKTKEDIVFEEELYELTIKYKSLKVVHILTDETKWKGEKGRLDTEKLTRLVPDLSSREVYICGPAAMIKDLTQICHQLGVSKGALHSELFEL